MGLHTGEPQLTEEGYVGMDVHRGARIAAVGHGGQVLVSEQTAQLLDGARLRDLGAHRLKDVGETRIYQLGDGDFAAAQDAAPGQPARARRPRSSAARRSSSTSFGC